MTTRFITTIEASGAAVALLRSQLAGEPMPPFQTPEANAIRDALRVLCDRADDAAFEALGRAVLHLLMETMTAHLQAERAATLAQLAAQTGKAGDQGLH